MANIQISSLPTYTGNTTDSYLVMNDSGNTTTYKVLTNNVVSGGSVNYSNLTEIPSQMVWNSQGFGPTRSRMKVAGGLMYNFTTTNLTIVTGTCYPQTIILQPGETLKEIAFNIPTFTTSGTVDVALYTLSATTSANAKCYVIGDLVYTISSGLTITSTGDKHITSLNYTASVNTTPNNVYAVCMFINGGNYQIPLLVSNNLIGHVVGGELAVGTYYRTYIRSITGTGGTALSSLSSYALVTATAPGWFLTYKTN